MVPCFICGKDATGAFIHGYAPSPDSQKVGLCSAHNTTENKKKAILHWIISQKNDWKQHVETVAAKSTSVNQTLTIRYTDGGVVTLECAKWEVTEQSTLQIQKPDNTFAFIPLQHIRQFDVKDR